MEEEKKKCTKYINKPINKLSYEKAQENLDNKEKYNCETEGLQD